MLLFGVWQKSATMGKDTEIKYSDLYNKVQQGQVLDAEIQGTDLRGHLKASPKDQFHTSVGTNYEDLQKAMLAANVKIELDATANSAGPFGCDQG
jgi:ATP-dependent Zn protease